MRHVDRGDCARLLCATRLLAAIAAAHGARRRPRRRRKLIVAISVDQLSSDLFDEYRAACSPAGWRGWPRGTAFRNGYQGHAATETCPGHSTILTGSRPARTGIIANNWFDLSQARSDKAVYCAEDERVAGIVVDQLHRFAGAPARCRRSAIC